MSSPLVLAFELRKLTEYLLNLGHPVGGSKARFFIAHGFDVSDPHCLADALTDHARCGWPGVVSASPYGSRHEVRGPLLTPRGTTPMIIAVWEMKPGTQLARLLTAYPG